MKNRYGIIYLIKNKINNKLYIGQTTKINGFNGRYWCKGKGIERVYNYYISKKENNEYYNSHLLSSIEKYGFEAFEIDKEFDIAYSEEELNRLEYMYIKVYKSTNTKYGYNIKEGGDNSKHSLDSKTRNGINIICIDDNKIYTSIKQAEEHYNVSATYIKNSFKRKHNINTYKEDKPIFRLLNRELKSNEKRCCICGKLYNVKSFKTKKGVKRTARCTKYCNTCKNKLKC